ncbi:MAG: hypothetical protein WD845_04975 [Pirellulales bacterium]
MKRETMHLIETARNSEFPAMSRKSPRTCALLVVIALCCAMPAIAEEAAAKVEPAAKPAQKAPAAKRRVVVAAPAAQAPAQNDGMVQQWLVQFRPMLLSELNLVRQVCDLTPEQRPAIRAAGEKSLREAAVQYAKHQQNGRVVRGQLQSQPSPSTIIRQGLAKAVESTLSAEQFARYSEQAKARAEQRKRATILGVVARLDGTLSLSLEQRDKIADALSSRWRDDWEQWLMVNRYGEQYFPQVPNDVLVPHLDSSQRTVWSGVQKISVGFQGSVAQPEEDVAWWGGKIVDEVGPPEPVDEPLSFGEAVVKTLTNWFGGAR